MKQKQPSRVDLRDSLAALACARAELKEAKPRDVYWVTALYMLTPMTAKQIGILAGLSEERIRQLIARGRRIVREVMEVS